MRQGTVVISRAGHDQGDWFAVVGLEGDFAFLADGKARKLERPKRKRLRHLAKTLTVLDAADYQTDRQLRKTLSKLSACFEKEGPDLGEG
ncbi:MAG: KOW domain-containing RNA-binding protein [Oscillospiraceae bacterium]